MSLVLGRASNALMPTHPKLPITTKWSRSKLIKFQNDQGPNLTSPTKNSTKIPHKIHWLRKEDIPWSCHFQPRKWNSRGVRVKLIGRSESIQIRQTLEQCYNLGLRVCDHRISQFLPCSIETLISWIPIPSEGHNQQWNGTKSFATSKSDFVDTTNSMSSSQLLFWKHELWTITWRGGKWEINGRQCISCWARRFFNFPILPMELAPKWLPLLTGQSKDHVQNDSR